MDQDEIIWFYDETGEKSKPEHQFLNNYEPCEFLADGDFKYTSTEHYYQAHKFSESNDPELDGYFNEVREQGTADKAKKLARKYQKSEKFNNEVWETRKDNVMRKALVYKFSQNMDLLDRLVKTGNARLSEESKRDFYWGGLMEGSKNMLGIMLMELRDNYVKEGKVFLEGSGLEKI